MRSVDQWYILQNSVSPIESHNIALSVFCNCPPTVIYNRCLKYLISHLKGSPWSYFSAKNTFLQLCLAQKDILPLSEEEREFVEFLRGQINYFQLGTVMSGSPNVRYNSFQNVGNFLCKNVQKWTWSSKYFYCSQRMLTCLSWHLLSD